MRHLGPDLRKGDVLLTNHPAAGGSHLPDLTVITPVSPFTIYNITPSNLVHVINLKQLTALHFSDDSTAQ